MKLGIGQIKHTEIWVLARRIRPICGYWTDQTDRYLGIGQTETGRRLHPGLFFGVGVLSNTATNGNTRGRFSTTATGGNFLKTKIQFKRSTNY